MVDARRVVRLGVLLGLALAAGSACRKASRTDQASEAAAASSVVPPTSAATDDYDQRLVTTLVTLREIVATANDAKDSCATAKREALAKVDGWRQPLAVACLDNLPRVCSAGPDHSHATTDDICDDVREFRRPRP